MEVVNARVTLASICTVLPSLMGFSKEMLSTEAVTTGALQCLVAEMAAAISIQYINRPPIRLPNTLVSLGSTISVIMIFDSAAVFVCINFALRKGIGWCLLLQQAMSVCFFLTTEA